MTRVANSDQTRIRIFLRLQVRICSNKNSPLIARIPSTTIFCSIVATPNRGIHVVTIEGTLLKMHMQPGNFLRYIRDFSLLYQRKILSPYTVYMGISPPIQGNAFYVHLLSPIQRGIILVFFNSIKFLLNDINFCSKRYVTSHYLIEITIICTRMCNDPEEITSRCLQHRQLILTSE